MKNNTIIDVLIGNIKTDQELLDAAEQQIENEREAKREIADRLKDYRRDVSVLLKYANDSQREKIKSLGFDFTGAEKGLNPVASLAFDLILKANDKQMTNQALYQAYVKSFKNPEDAFSYTEFNIKCRPLFNTQRLLRIKGKDPKSSKDDIIRLNAATKKLPSKKSDNESK